MYNAYFQQSMKSDIGQRMNFVLKSRFTIYVRDLKIRHLPYMIRCRNLRQTDAGIYSFR